MRRIHSVVLGSALVLAIVLTGCGSDDTASTSTSSSSADVAQAGASSVDTGSKTGAKECSTAADSAAKLIVNWQLVAQLPNATDVTEWKDRLSTVGTVSEFGAQLDALQAAVGDDANAAKAIDYMKGADAIVERGLGGDSAALADLKDYLGSDLATTLGRKTPIMMAMSTAGC